MLRACGTLRCSERHFGGLRHGGWARHDPALSERIGVIVNPASGQGRGARLLPAVRAAFAAVGVRDDDVRLSAAPGDELNVATRAMDEGCTTLVAVGGDGTWSNVANAILRRGADCRLAIVSAGSGNDFVKSLGRDVPASDLPRTARLAVDGPDTRIDVGRVEEWYFVNAMGFGFDAAVLDDAARLTWPRGRLVYFYSALRQLFGYQGIDVSTNGGAHERYLMYVVANGRHFGGAFPIAPSASVSDGMLDIVAIGDLPPGRRLPLFAAATRGKHIGRPGVTVQLASTVTLRFEVAPYYDRDGELQRAKSATVEITCVPRALRVVGALRP